MNTSLVHFGLFSAAAALCVMYAGALPKETYMTAPQKIASNGYPIQKHRVSTPDGYVLQMHRIPHGRGASKPIGRKRRAVLIMHGMGGCSDNFVVMGPGRSMAYILADSGYDVWLGNFRGNQYTTHKNLTRKDPKFWDYSLHEHGNLDLPAMIDHVLNTTSLRKLMYIGHSMGTTSFFILLSLKPEYNHKVVSFAAISPAVYMDHLKPVVKKLTKELRIGEVIRAHGFNYLAVPLVIRDVLINKICTAKEPKDDICLRFVYRYLGENYEQHDWNLSPVILASIQPMSLNELEHYAKIAHNGVFTTFEGGLWGPVMPYNLSNVRVPSLVVYGENDQLTRKEGIARLARELKSLNTLEGMTTVCDCPKFNHIDFIIAKDVGTLFTRPLVNIINRLYDKYYPD